MVVNGKIGGSRAAGGEGKLCTGREDREEEGHASLQWETGGIEYELFIFFV